MKEPARLLVIHIATSEVSTWRDLLRRRIIPAQLSHLSVPSHFLPHSRIETIQVLRGKRTSDQSTPSMASSTARLTFRIVLVVLLLLFLFYAGRPLYWKISATIDEIRQNKQTVRQGISQIVQEAQRSVGW